MDSVSADSDTAAALCEGSDRRSDNSPLSILFSVAAVVVTLDQLTKWWAVEALDDGRVIDVVWTARFNLVRNDGAAFSLGSGLTPLIAIAAMAVSVALVVAARRVRYRSAVAAMGLILGGAVGNIIDRFLRSGDGFLRGRVVDFIDFQWWPVFNIADIGVVVGGFLLVWLLSESSDSDHDDGVISNARDNEASQ